jgi:hypothetical protein
LPDWWPGVSARHLCVRRCRSKCASVIRGIICEINRSDEEFTFAIVSDRTGGHRAKIFSRAVEYLNLLQPAFVVSVGDLIEGYTEDVKKLEQEWQEFNSFIARLQMPFFYVPGNHDYANPVQERMWKEKFSQPYYHFVYQDVLFLMVNSDDPPKTQEGHISQEQIAYFERVLKANPRVRWTLIFLHRPLWTSSKVAETGWLEFERLLQDRPYTVFCRPHSPLSAICASWPHLLSAGDDWRCQQASRGGLRRV